MKHRNLRQLLALMSALSVGAGWMQAQTAPATATASPGSENSSEEETIVLDPFTVTTEHEGYKADDTLAGGRVRTSLKDTPASLSIVTKKLMDDLGVTNATDLLVYTASTEVAGLFGNYSGLGNRSGGITFSSAGSAEAGRLVNPAGVNRARGLTAMDNTRNYLLSDIPWDGFNISRVDISRGPNSFLFGTGSPSGIANVSTNEAAYKDRGSVEFKYGSFGSSRESLDYNKVLLADQLAIRLDLVNSNTKYKQDPAFNNSKRVYGAVRYDPQFLKSDSAHTKIMASFEHGDVNSNNPRILPPVDYVTGYLGDPRKSTGGIDPWLYNQDTLGGRADPNYSLWTSAGSIGNQYKWSGTPQFYWDGQAGGLIGAGQPGFTVAPGVHNNTWSVHSSGFANYASTVNYIYTRKLGVSEANAPFQGATRGTVSYLDQTLSDTSIFDFYNKLIDGDNKREWQKWDAYNASVTQTLFNDRLTVQALFDHEKYTSGSWSLFADRTPLIMLDLDKYLLAGSPSWLGNPTVNPNVGRPIVFADQGKRNVRSSSRDNYQATAAYLLDFERDFNMKSLLGRILGHHSFTGLAGEYQRSSLSESYNLNGVDYNYLKVTGSNLNAQPKNNNFNWLAYIGPSLLKTTGSGANLSSLPSNLTPPSSTSFRIWSKDWTNSSVLPTAAYTYPQYDGTTKTGTQAENPANYRGFISSTFPIISGASNPVLAQGGDKAKQTIDSLAVMYQGHFWDDTIVPSVGFRQDKTKQQGASANTTGDVINLNYGITDPGVTATTKSTSYGVAVHLPKAIKKHLPEGTDLTFHYFHGENETPRVRYGMDGLPLPNESGKTDDYSVQFDGLHDRLTVRLTYFKTKNLNSSNSIGEPLGNWMVRGLPALTLQYAGWALAERKLGRNAETGEIYNAPASWDTWRSNPGGPWGWRPHSWMDTRPEQAAAFEQAMKTAFVETFPQTYWDAWSYHVDVEAIKRGDWLHINPTWDDPWNSAKMGGSSTINGEYPTIDQNLESKGYELELTYRPLKNWDITLNASKVDATQTGYGAGATKVLTGMADLYLGTAIQYGNIWDGYEGLKNNFLSNIWAPYLTQIALVGGEQPEQRKYRFNAISNYSFSHGIVKGLNVGGAFRWEDKAILGYGIHEATIYGEKAWIPDVNAPIYGPTEQHLDMWVGYGHKLNKNIDWRLQFNIRNVGENDHLVTVAVQPDGTIAQRRIASGAMYDMTLKFSF